MRGGDSIPNRLVVPLVGGYGIALVLTGEGEGVIQELLVRINHREEPSFRAKRAVIKIAGSSVDKGSKRRDLTHAKEQAHLM